MTNTLSPRYDCREGDHVNVRTVSIFGTPLPAASSEAVIVDCCDQWARVQYLVDGVIELVHMSRLTGADRHLQIG